MKYGRPFPIKKALSGNTVLGTGLQPCEIQTQASVGVPPEVMYPAAYSN